ncbi:hypothetical protein AWL63_13275 [Sphingomonas panacis]|uniref:Phage holin family protein n=1 Tax=Sphingomonas panacis TaxID=1560345 RepID=A0A1B3ZBI6_9SPHN|nr:phage holin family protein [Sphingomonas panacis]AOH84790.1 hypothetical protein AWL63_13275 [Sphingomonas panacis]
MAENTTDDGIGTLISRLVEDAKAFAFAEIAVYRARLMKAVADYRAAAILGVAALILAHAAVIALLVGIILSVAQALGPIWATVITVGGALLVAGVLVWIAVSIVSAKGKAR